MRVYVAGRRSAGCIRDHRLAAASLSPAASGRYFYLLTWRPYAALGLKIKNDARREAFLVIGFAALHWANGSELNAPDNQRNFWTDAYFSGATFFTLGLGDVVPDSGMSHVVTVIEGGSGFAFLALLIGYLPILYQMSARRETNVSMMDQRAGSPPSTAELVRRNVDNGDPTELVALLRDWEMWVADLLESHLSYSTLQALSEYLLMDLPLWVPPPNAQDNWETTAWDFASPAALLGPNTPFWKPSSE